MGLFGDRKGLLEKFEELQESRQQKCNMFLSLKEGLQQDNTKLSVIEEEAAEQIHYMQSLLEKVNRTRDYNERTISEIERIVG